AAQDIPVETQYLLCSLVDGRYALVLPMLDGSFRSTLQGTAEGDLHLIVESGDPAVTTNEAVAVFLAIGDNPYALMEAGAKSVMARMKTGHLRSEKPLPPFVDYFGWCTWDAFYQEVSHEKVRQGLESFVEGGVQPRFLILDDGWQSEQATATEERRLVSFAPNAKFSGDLTPTVQMAKNEFTIEHFFVWHAFQGYWAGVNKANFPQYHIVDKSRRFSPGMQHYHADIDNWFGNLMGVVAPDSIHRFYNDYHRSLALQGVDGVKVDSQAAIESVGQGFGGRVAMMKAYHEALEGSVQTHFFGQIINCMSCVNEMIYSALNSNLTRSSTDFWPNRPASHGLHIYTNAQSSMWLGEFVHPDWDMFQSGHEMGPFHAAARAISGSPVYVSDKPDGHNFDVLRKLVLSDGTVLRPDGIARPTLDCLFHDATKEDVLLKIFNMNGDAGVIGVFNCRYHAEEDERVALEGTVCPQDVDGIAGETFVIYAHTTGALTQCSSTETVAVTLPELAYEIVTIVPIAEGIAPIGLADKFNSAGAIIDKGIDAAGNYAVMLRDGGHFVAWCDAAPIGIVIDGCSVPFTYDAATNMLSVTIEHAGLCTMTIVR
ncbi:MAG TPA: Sip1-related alpha-galactosidase, partial [Armatimonadota bacterium]|nr:Sip1-related alpha-galactosidase [Armatimonadota bacterium]